MLFIIRVITEQPMLYALEYANDDKSMQKLPYHHFSLLHSGKKFDLPVAELAYMKKCDKSLSMMLRASAKVVDQDKPIAKMEKLVMSVPDLKLEVCITQRV